MALGEKKPSAPPMVIPRNEALQKNSKFLTGEIKKKSKISARLAQSVERKALNLVVVGSSPRWAITFGFQTNHQKMFQRQLFQEKS